MTAAVLELTEKDVYEACWLLLTRLGYPTYRLSQARAAKQTPGLPDLIAFVLRPTLRMLLFIEVKKPGGRQRPEQKMLEWQTAQLETEKVRYLLVHSAQELADQLAEIR